LIIEKDNLEYQLNELKVLYQQYSKWLGIIKILIIKIRLGELTDELSEIIDMPIDKVEEFIEDVTVKVDRSKQKLDKLTRKIRVYSPVKGSILTEEQKKEKKRVLRLRKMKKQQEKYKTDQEEEEILEDHEFEEE